MSDPSAPPAPTVDAVICTRNRADKIAFAVESVLACDHPDFRLTVIDQSTDGATREALEPILDRDPRLVYHHSEQAGLSRAYNTGVSLTSSDFLAFTDDDCIVPSDWISTIATAVDQDDEVDLIYGQVLPLERVADDTKLIPWLPIEKPERMGPGTKFRVFGMGANFAARRRLFERIGPFDEILGGGGPLRSAQDYDMAYRTWRGGSVIALRPEVQIRHDGRREEEDWPSLNLAYGVGDGAFYSKHVRCRDGYATWMFTRYYATELTRYGAKWVLRRRPKNWPYLRGIATGVMEGRKFDVDRSTRLYVAK